jgi:catechol 2,3-dioxygenase-like lactoylglutathione lyase family enzyme
MLTPHCINLSVADIDEVSQWYQKVVGFEPVTRKSFPEMKVEIAFLRLGDFELELIRFDDSVSGTEHPDPPRHAQVRGMTHIGFRVDSVDAKSEALQRQGVPPLWGRTYPDLHMKVVFVRDPAGNLVKFVERLP